MIRACALLALPMLPLADVTRESSVQIRIGLIDMRDRSASEILRESIQTKVQRMLGEKAPSVRVLAKHGPYDDALDAAIQDIVTAKPHLIIAVSIRAALACKRLAPVTTPVVFVAYENPVTAGIVRSLERPETNATGVWNDLDLHCKRVEILSRACPAVKKLVIVVDRNQQRNNSTLESLAACSMKKLSFELLQLATLDEVKKLRFLLPKLTSGLLVPHSGLCNLWPDELVRATNECELPSIFDGKWLVERGALMSLEPIELDEATALAEIAYKVLSGTPAANIRIERPRTTRLSLNLEVAKRLSLGFPDWLLASADDVI